MLFFPCLTFILLVIRTAGIGSRFVISSLFARLRRCWLCSFSRKKTGRFCVRVFNDPGGIFCELSFGIDFGIVYGAGSSENRGGDYVKNVLSNIAGGVAGRKITRGVFGVAGAPVMREILNPVIGETVGAFADKTIDKLFDGK